MISMLLKCLFYLFKLLDLYFFLGAELAVRHKNSLEGRRQSLPEYLFTCMQGRRQKNFQGGTKRK